MFDELSTPVLIEAIQEYVWVRGKMVDLALKKNPNLHNSVFLPFYENTHPRVPLTPKNKKLKSQGRKTPLEPLAGAALSEVSSTLLQLLPLCCSGCAAS